MAQSCAEEEEEEEEEEYEAEEEERGMGGRRGEGVIGQGLGGGERVVSCEGFKQAKDRL